MTSLSANVNAIAYLRNRRNLPWPNLVDLAALALDAGAAGLTVHPRPDERHITAEDVHDLADLLKQEPYSAKEFNIEGYPEDRLFSLCDAVRPDQVTLVPDHPSQATSDHGWNISENEQLLVESIEYLKSLDTRVALFVDCDPDAAARAHKVGADRIEIFTGPFALAHLEAQRDNRLTSNLKREIEAIRQTTLAARSRNLGVNAGHDLTLENLPALLSEIQDIDEVSIGHALTADALRFGFSQTIARFVSVLKGKSCLIL